MNTPKNQYVVAHKRVKESKGPAHEHKCQCGAQALDWALQHSGEHLHQDHRGRWYSDQVEDYLPMCRRCHRSYDLENQPGMAELHRKNVESMKMKASEWRESNHDKVLESCSNAGKIGGVVTKSRRDEDPERRQQFVENVALPNAVKARKALAKKRDQDPTLGKRQIAEAVKAKSRCIVCGLETRPGSLGMHQKYSGHAGKEKVIV